MCPLPTMKTLDHHHGYNTTYQVLLWLHISSGETTLILDLHPGIAVQATNWGTGVCEEDRHPMVSHTITSTGGMACGLVSTLLVLFWWLKQRIPAHDIFMEWQGLWTVTPTWLWFSYSISERHHEPRYIPSRCREIIYLKWTPCEDHWIPRSTPPLLRA